MIIVVIGQLVSRASTFEVKYLLGYQLYIARSDKENLQMLNIVYDLRVLPASYDFPYFMALADARRRLESAEDGFVLWIITGKSRRPSDWDWAPSMTDSQITSAIDSRLFRMIIPMTKLFPSIKRLNVIDEQFFSTFQIPVFHPAGYSFQNPRLGVYHKGWFLLPYSGSVELRCLSNQAAAIIEARRYLIAHTGMSCPVVITLRNNTVSHDQSRNTRFEVINKIISHLLSKGFVVAVIPDTSLQGIEDLRHSPHLLTAASFDVTLRSAIYEVAAFCLFEPTGPLVLAQLNPSVRFISYGIAWSSKFSADYQLKRGYQRDVNFIAPNEPTQLYLWDSLSPNFLDEWLRKGGMQP